MTSIALQPLTVPAHRVELEDLRDFLREHATAPSDADVFLTERGTLHISWGGQWRCGGDNAATA